ncbi:MAG: hypothetical protein LBR35_00485, partial [Rickettsiales bacterium]|nr:hypothetical protein [Rickettsiales bacterium]
DGGEFKNDWISAVAGNSVDVDAGIASVQGDYNFCFAFWVNRGYYVVLDSGTHPVSKAATPPKRGIK